MKRLIRIIVILVFVPLPAFAVETIKSPIVNEGDMQLDHIGKYQYDSDPKRDDQKEYDLGVSYGLNDRWRIRPQFEFEEKGSGDLHYKDFNVDNIVSLTGNDSFMPTAFYLNALIADRSDSSHSLTAGLITMKEVGPTKTIANLFLRHEVGDTASNKMSVIYRLQSIYSLYKYANPGFELWGDTNKHDAFQDQSLQIGPGVFGKFEIGSANNFGYELVYLRGATPGSHDGTLKWRLLYDFP
ncbi:MAG TPA: hypothetical protein VFR09_05890 [Alphaproteobacteria bacterium]|nr:hypothetical protein [Alphaproteobacteria bacterium]